MSDLLLDHQLSLIRHMRKHLQGAQAAARTLAGRAGEPGSMTNSKELLAYVELDLEAMRWMDEELLRLWKRIGGDVK